jgi:tRNA threonylcarbamoyladenosine biosynthesis protein TsaE
MNSIIFTSESEDQTKKLARQIGTNTISSFFIGLKGDLAAGKTSFVQGLAQGLGTNPSCYVTSPTYNIIQIYPGKMTLVHADLYRISDIDELELTGFAEIIEQKNTVLAVEWPEKIENDFNFDLIIEFEILKDNQRKINLISCGREGLLLLEKLKLES